MRNFSCIIIDDEPLVVRVIEEHLEILDFIQCVNKFHDPTKALSFLNSGRVDLVFLDINMPLISGLDFVETLSTPPKIIFTTAYREFAVEAFDLNAVDYLVKPISFERFLKAVNKFQDSVSLPQENMERQDYIIIKENKVNYKILFEDIIFIESMDNYLKVHTNKKLITCYGKLSDFEEKLPDPFLRIHRSYIVNTKFITSYTSTTISIEKHTLKIGRNYKGSVEMYWNK